MFRALLAIFIANVPTQCQCFSVRSTQLAPFYFSRIDTRVDLWEEGVRNIDARTSPSRLTRVERPRNSCTVLLHRNSNRRHLGIHRNSDAGLAPQSDEHDQGSTTGKAILSLAIPALAGLTIDPLMTLADTVFVGRTAVDADALAGVGSSSALLTFSFYLFSFLCTTTTPLVASRRAAGDEDGALAIGGQALSLALALGSTVTIMLILFSQQLLGIMGTGLTGNVANDYATAFLTIRAFAAPAVLVSSAATGILRGYLDTRTAFVILSGANIINLVLDVVLITAAKMGPTGAAIATTTAEWICALSFLGVLAGKLPSADGELGSNQDKLRAGSFDKQTDVAIDSTMVTVVPSLSIPSWEEMQPLVIASSSVFLRSVVLQLSYSGAAAMAARGESSSGGASACVAAHQIAVQLWLFCSFMCDALAAASQALVADAVGRKDAANVQDLSKAVFAYSLWLGITLAAILGIGTVTHFLLDLFTSDAESQSELSKILVLIIFAQPLNSFVFTAEGVLQGASEFTYQAKTMALSVGIAVFCFLGLEHLGYGQNSHTLVHVWYSLLILQFMRGLTSLLKVIDHDGPIKLLRKQ